MKIQIYCPLEYEQTSWFFSPFLENTLKDKNPLRELVVDVTGTAWKGGDGKTLTLIWILFDILSVNSFWAIFKCYKRINRIIQSSAGKVQAMSQTLKIKKGLKHT